jgi:hypothetical protein
VPESFAPGIFHTGICLTILRRINRQNAQKTKKKELATLTDVSSTKIEGNFFSVAMTTPLAALIPSEVWPDPTAVSACSICTSFPDGLKVVREKEYWLSPMAG